MFDLLLIAAIAAGAIFVFGDDDDSDNDDGPGKPPDEPPAVEVALYRGYTIEATQDVDGFWSWAAYTDEAWAQDERGVPAAQGLELLEAQLAIADAKSWVDAQLGGDASAQPEVVPKAIRRRGVQVSADCSEVAVYDLDKWIAFAAPLLEEIEDPDANGVLLTTLTAAIPECVFGTQQIRGRTWAQTVESVQSKINDAKAGELLDVAEAEEVVAARIVGMSAPKRNGSAQWYVSPSNGFRFAIVVTQTPSGNNLHWRLWKGPRSGEAERDGVAPNVEQAYQDAQQVADSYQKAAIG